MLKNTFLKLICLSILVTSVGEPAHAGWPKWKWKDIEKPFRQLPDVVSLGEVGRRRDRERADAAQAMANQQAASAAEARAQRIQELKKDIVQIQATQHVLESYKDDLGTLKENLESAVQMSGELIRQAGAKGIQDQALMAMIEIQKRDLARWLKNLEETTKTEGDSSTKSQAVARELKSKFISYLEQLQNIPKLSDQDLEVVLENTSVIGFESMRLVDTLIAEVAEQIAANAENIKKIETDINSL